MRIEISCISRKCVDIISSRFSVEELKEIFLLKSEIGFSDELTLSVEEDELFKPETDWKIRDPELSKYWSDKLNFWKANHVFVGATQAEIESVMKNNPADYYYFKDCENIDLKYKNAMIKSIEDCSIKDLDVAYLWSIRGNTKIERVGTSVNIRGISENTEIDRLDGAGNIDVICGNAKIKSITGKILINQIYGNAEIGSMCNAFVLVKNSQSKIGELIGGAAIRIEG